MPRIEDLIDLIEQAKFISSLDLTKGYWQVPVAEEDRGKTAFTTLFGLLQFRLIPFGLQGVPEDDGPSSGRTERVRRSLPR